MRRAGGVNMGRVFANICATISLACVIYRHFGAFDAFTAFAVTLIVMNNLSLPRIDIVDKDQK